MNQRLRTIEQAYKQIKEGDPETSITLTAIRKLVTTGTIQSARVGTKYLISLDTIENYFGYKECTKSELSAKETARLIDWLKANGHTDEEILQCIKYIAGTQGPQQSNETKQ